MPKSSPSPKSKARGFSSRLAASREPTAHPPQAQVRLRTTPRSPRSPQQHPIPPAPHHGETGEARLASIRRHDIRPRQVVCTRPVMIIDQRQNHAPCQRIERPRVEVRIPLIPPRQRRGNRDHIARLRSRPHIEHQLARSRQLAIRQRNLVRGDARAIGDEDAEVKRLERSGRDGESGCERKGADQTAISLTSPSTISRGSVSSCTSSTLTPGASSISFSPLLRHIEHAIVGDDAVDALHAGQRQTARARESSSRPSW